MPRMGQLIETDDRGRANLGRPGRQYVMHEEMDGTLVLEPAVVITEVERRFLTNKELVSQIDEARAHPEQRIKRPPRPPR